LNLYEFIQTITDKRLPQVHGAGILRSGAQVHFGKGRGRFFLSQTLTVQKGRKGKVSITNTPY
jgi:hypothetical protein